MILQHDIRTVVGQYVALQAVGEIQPLGSARGFSGAQFWRLAAQGKNLCLRRWPLEHPDRQRLGYIHAVLRHAAAGGVGQLAVPLATRDGRTFVEHRSHLWELAAWMPGKADFHQHPSPARLAAAMTFLAQFHMAVASFRQPPRARQPAPQASPGLTERAVMLARLLQGGLAALSNAVDSNVWPEIEPLARRLIALFPGVARIMQPRLQVAAESMLVLQPCIRDIWHDHLLFSGDELTGVVDFGAVRDEFPASDVARLLGSLVGDDQAGWQAGLAAYESVRPLSAVEQSLVRVFDESAVLLSGMNWLQWIYVERRHFEHQDQVVRRLSEILQRLDHLARPAH